ncbi:hypothetical protein G5I_03974 [Acromyrmex echinatior]|uniref:Uncharacterized protein n=1 Tax=Acromyrmex echinatior TaxID=103372 RepID=F4WEG8_ACREC|nr:hypothetical protein G5I_03974 [Acromyrmex echinatior]
MSRDFLLMRDTSEANIKKTDKLVLFRKMLSTKMYDTEYASKRNQIFCLLISTRDESSATILRVTQREQRDRRDRSGSRADARDWSTARHKQSLPASAVRCRICTTRCHTRRRQGRGASRTQGRGEGLPRTVSPSPHHEGMGVYRRPHQLGHLSYDPSVAFPTRRTGATGATGATLRPRDPARGGGVRGAGEEEGTVGDRSRVVSRESPTLPSVSSAHTVLRSRRDPRLPPLPIGPICPQSFW